MTHSNWYTLKITGIDTSKFLQGQLPLNLDKLADLKSSFSFSAVHTGKVIAVYRLVKISSELVYILIYGEDMAKELLSHLKKFAIFSKVTFELTPANITFSFNPELIAQAHQYLTHITGLSETELKIADLAAPVKSITQQVYCVQTQLGLNIYFSDPVSTEQLIITENEIAIDNTEFLALSAYFGIDYQLIAPYRNKFLPQALGFDLGVENCISYTKGCYQGQEGIARAKYRGANPHLYQKFRVTDTSMFTKSPKSIILNPEEYELLLQLDNENIELGTKTIKKTGTILTGYFIDNTNAKFKDLLPTDTKIVIFNTLISKKLVDELDNFFVQTLNSSKPVALQHY